MEINSEKYSLAENKLLILYTLSKVGKPISHNKLQELVISICDMNYFYFQQYLLDLLDDKYVNKFVNNNEDYYELTLEGKEGLELAIDLLPGILKLEVDSKFKKNFDTIKNVFRFSFVCINKGTIISPSFLPIDSPISSGNLLSESL